VTYVSATWPLRRRGAFRRGRDSKGWREVLRLDPRPAVDAIKAAPWTGEDPNHPGGGGRLVRHHRSRQLRGATILRRPVGAPFKAGRGGGGPPLLFEARTHRVRPAWTTSATEWNAMYASALAKPPPHRQSGLAARRGVIGDFLYANLRRSADGRWLRSWQAGGGARISPTPPTTDGWSTASPVGRADRGGVDGPASRRPTPPRPVPRRPGRGILHHGHDAEALLVRTKDLFDGATPSANGWRRCPGPARGRHGSDATGGGRRDHRPARRAAHRHHRSPTLWRRPTLLRRGSPRCGDRRPPRLVRWRAGVGSRRGAAGASHDSPLWKAGTRTSPTCVTTTRARCRPPIRSRCRRS